MIPFPGEAVLVEDAADITSGEDYTLWEDIAYRAGSRTLAAGSTWRAFVYSGDMDYLEETGLALTVEWVVEVTSGTVTVTAAEGIDPTYSDYTGPLPTPLGTHTLTAGENRIASTFTGDQVGDLSGAVDSAFRLGLTATAGSAVVQQVKMYVHPVGGPLGGLVDQPGFDTSEQAVSIRHTIGTELARSGTGSSLDWEASWDAAAAALVADTVDPGPYAFADIPTGGVVPHAATEFGLIASQIIDLDSVVDSGLTVPANIAVLRGPDPAAQNHVGPGVAGYIRPPTEVRDEAQEWLYPQTGAGTVQWVNAVVTVEQAARPNGPIGDVTVATTATDTPVIVSETGGGFDVDVALIDGGIPLDPPPSGTTYTAVPMVTSGRYIFVHLSHTAATDLAAWPGATSNTEVGINAAAHYGAGDPSGAGFLPVKAYVSMPPYRVWVPGAAPEVASPRVRQLHRDDGQGMTPPRHFGGASRRNTGRHFGYD